MMIKNERQYRITRAQAEKFVQALAQMEEQPREAAGVHPLLRKAEADALRSQLESLRDEVAAYAPARRGSLSRTPSTSCRRP